MLLHGPTTMEPSSFKEGHSPAYLCPALCSGIGIECLEVLSVIVPEKGVTLQQIS